MLGLMQDYPLMISSIIRHAARHHGSSEVVSRGVDGSLHRQDYVTLERRARRLARVLQGLGVQPADRVATLAWNGHRHLELYYAISGMGAICHTVNPRLSGDDIAFILRDAADVLLFADTTFAPAIAAASPNCGGTLRAVVFMCDRAGMPEVALPPGIAPLCYEDSAGGRRRQLRLAAVRRTHRGLALLHLGHHRPAKGVLFWHRSTVLHAYATNAANVFGAALPRPGAAGRADVSRQRLGPALYLGPRRRRVAGDAGAASGRR